MIKAIIFDMDGVLIDTSSIIIEVYKKAFEDYPIKIDGSIKKLMGLGSNELIKRCLEKNGIVYTEKIMLKIDDKKQKANIRLIDKVKVLDGVVDLLNLLQKKYRLALASSNSADVVNSFLIKKSFKKYFPVVVTKDDIKEAKPNPEVFLKAAKKLNVDPDECVVIEDSIFGVEAAKKAGMKCIGVTTGVYVKKDLEKAGADMVVKLLTELKKVKEFIDKLE